jgi:nucleoside-diphosphate-sugar epimerase
MQVLLIGGSGFIGPYVARDLLARGHQVAVFHRGQSKTVLPDGVVQILGDRHALAASADEFGQFAPDVVVDFILASERQAITTMDTFRGMAGRIVALSSGDVYRAIAIMYGFDTGLQPVPLTEESDLRMHKPYNPERLAQLRDVFPWLADDYDKIPVERVVMSDPQLPGTVLRLPMTYGPGDPLHRLHGILKRIQDGRPAILIQEDAAAWRGPRGYVENVAAGIALAAVSLEAAGRIYNIAELQSFSELEWAQKIGRIAKWSGSVYAIAKEHTPEHLRVPYNSAQHWSMSSNRIRQELGYAEPVAIDTALERTIAWERANPPVVVDPKQFDYAAEDSAGVGVVRSIVNG